MHFRFSILVIIFIAVTLRANVPGGWQFQEPTPLGGPLPTTTPTGTFMAANMDSVELPEAGESAPFTMMSSMSSSTGNIADEITPEIQNLATSLQNDPVRILEFVYNAIEYEHYYGSKKGAQLTLLEGSGNDMDQCSLLVALLRAAGYQAEYVTIGNVVPYDSTAPYYSENPVFSLCSGVSWLGLDPVPYPGVAVNPGDKPAGWSDDEYKKSFLLYHYFDRSGFPVWIYPQYKSCVLAQRTIVRVTINDVSVIWDPSAKQLSGKDEMDLLAATGFSKSAFLTSLGGTVTSTYVSGLSSTVIQSTLSTATTALNSAIKTSRPNDSVRDVLGRKENLPHNFSGFGNWFQIHGFLQNDDSDTIPESLMSSLELQINTGTPHVMKMPALQGKRLSVTATGNTVQIRLDEEVIHSATVTAASYTLTMTAKHPHFESDGVTPKHDDSDGGKTYKKASSYALIYGFAPSRRLLQSRQRILDGYIEQVRAGYPSWVDEDGSIEDLQNLPDATLKRQITTELLNIMGVNWLYQTGLANYIAASLNDLNICMFHRFGRMGQESGFYIDVPLMYANNNAKNGISNNTLTYALTYSYMFSALEHGIIDQYNLAANGAVSTTQIFHIANASCYRPKYHRIFDRIEVVGKWS